MEFIKCRIGFLLVGMLVSFSTFSADWDLFAFKQKSYFYEQKAGNEQYIRVFFMDSVLTNGNTSVQYFRKKALSNPNCYQEIRKNLLQWDNESYNIDSITQQNDMVYYYSKNSTTPFTFLPKSKLGDSWTVTSTYGTGTSYQITFTCASITATTFLGISDSVKVFSISTNPSQSQLNNLVFKLSKKHGLIEFVPFQLLMQNPSFSTFSTIKLNGIDSVGKHKGFKEPKLSDYFHLKPGDIVLWKNKYEFGISSSTTYYLDSITNVVSVNDSIVYTYNRTNKDMFGSITVSPNAKDYFTLKSDLGVQISSFSDWSKLSSVSGLIVFQRIKLTIDNISGDTIFEIYPYNNSYSFQFTTCKESFIADYGNSNRIDTKIGIKEKYTSFTSETIEGSRVNGITTGNIVLGLENTVSSRLGYTFYPNPVDQFLSFENLAFDSKYELLSSTGQFLSQGQVFQNKISTDMLQPGLYFLRITNKNGSQMDKFLKE